MAARKNRGTKVSPMPDDWRHKISQSVMLARLLKCAEGKLVLSSVQAQVGLGLLKKVLPDQTENKTEHSGSITVVVKKPA